MESLEAAAERARDLGIEALADAIQEIGFECTRCGRCCSGTEAEPHTATIFPDEVRTIQAGTGGSWEDVARPVPFGLDDGEGETFEWALQTDSCGDCQFLMADQDGSKTACSIYADRPRICQTYPFSVDIAGTEGYDEAVVESVGPVRAHECPGLGADIERERAVDLADLLKERAIREIAEALAVREAYDPSIGEGEPVVVHDSEGAKRPDGTRLD